jgi:hypothetical protein
MGNGLNVELTKEDLVNLVSSTTPSMKECCDYTDEGLMSFTGNQWNENWSWQKSKLMSMSDQKLLNLYKKHKNG